MPGKFDSEVLTVECPECGAEVKTTIGEARRSQPLRCPNGHVSETDGSQLDRETRKAEQAIDRFERGL